MLATVKSTISSVPYITFEQHFTKYVMDIQDTNIDEEMSFLLRHNVLTPKMVARIVDTTYERLAK